MVEATVVVLYAEDPSKPERRRWIARLIRELREVHGIDARDWDTAVEPGHDLTQFMERATAHSRWILAVCTPDYKERFDNRERGVGYEGRGIAVRMMERPDGTVLPLLREGDNTTSVPLAFKGIRWLDFREGVNQRHQVGRLADLINGTWADLPQLGSRAQERLVWVMNDHPDHEAFRWDDAGFGDGHSPPQDVSGIPQHVWEDARADRWRAKTWLREVPEPPWATPGLLLYRHEHPTQPYITAFRLHYPPVPLRHGDVVELSEHDMALPQNAHLRRHWVPRRPNAGGPLAGRFNQVDNEDAPTWTAQMHPGFAPEVDYGLVAPTPVPPERAAEIIARLGMAVHPGARKAPRRPRTKAEPLEVVLSTLDTIRDELGLSVIRLGDLHAFLYDYDIDLRGTWDLVQSIQLAGNNDPDPRQRFPVRVHPSEVLVVRLPEGRPS